MSFTSFFIGITLHHFNIALLCLSSYTLPRALTISFISLLIFATFFKDSALCFSWLSIDLIYSSLEEATSSTLEGSEMLASICRQLLTPFSFSESLTIRAMRLRILLSKSAFGPTKVLATVLR